MHKNQLGYRMEWAKLQYSLAHVKTRLRVGLFGVIGRVTLTGVQHSLVCMKTRLMALLDWAWLQHLSLHGCGLVGGGTSYVDVSAGMCIDWCM